MQSISLISLGSEMGCATKQYAGPAIENPWSLRNYGTTIIPDTSEPSGSDDDFLDQLRFYRDYEPLYRVLHDGKTKSDDDQKKSDAETSPFDLTASIDTSLFNTFLADPVDYSAFLPSGDDSTSSDISWDINTDPGSNYVANLDLGTDLFTNTDPGSNYLANLDFGTDLFTNTDPGITLDANYDFGTDFFASSDTGSNDYDFFNGDGLFTKKRMRRSARDFLGQDKL